MARSAQTALRRPAEAASAAEMERPIGPEPNAPAFGSDAIADVLRALELPFVALNPGASYRGLHDSLVNYLGNRRPQMLLCLHEEHAVALAHGYAKVAERPMAAIVHSNVGLMHGSMAIFNAWCDRVPVIVLGATGPVDAAKRRPWIDWIHTSADQGALVRAFVKWDNQPASVAAAQEALLRAALIAETAPRGPVYVNLDAALQEAKLPEAPATATRARYAPPPPSHPNPQAVRDAAELLSQARAPLILAGRVSRNPEAWAARVRLAETLSARVLTDLKVGAAFPTDHPLSAAPPGLFPRAEALEALRAADVILSLDWVDLAGTLGAAFSKAAVSATVIQASLDSYIHNGWSMDHQGLPPVDVHLLTDPDIAVSALNALLGTDVKRPPRAAPPASKRRPAPGPTISVADLGRGLRAACGERDVCLMRLPLSWDGSVWPFRHPLDYLGYDGGGGIGSGPGMAVGAALALKGGNRLPVAVIGDGDYLMGVTALWTAAHYRIPLLLVVANNQSYFNDEIHQDRVARTRERPTENRWIGQRMSDPELDLVRMAQAQGAEGFGPVRSREGLEAVLRDAIAAVEAGNVAVVDVRVEPGYEAATQATIGRPE